MAHLSGDEGLIEAFRSGEDLHRFVGSRVFGVPPAEVTPAMRSKIKAMSYGLAYGLSAFGLSRQLVIPVDEARGLMDEYFDRFGGVRDYLQGIVAQARRTGYTETILGRRRYLPDLTSDNRQRREMAERMALNAPIQGSAADVIKVAMLEVDAALREQGLRSRLLLQVHDELVLEVAPGELERLEALVREAMAAPPTMSVPLDVSVGVGRPGTRPATDGQGAAGVRRRPDHTDPVSRATTAARSRSSPRPASVQAPARTVPTSAVTVEGWSTATAPTVAAAQTQAAAPSHRSPTATRAYTSTWTTANAVPSAANRATVRPSGAYRAPAASATSRRRRRHVTATTAAPRPAVRPSAAATARSRVAAAVIRG